MVSHEPKTHLTGSSTLLTPRKAHWQNLMTHRGVFRIDRVVDIRNRSPPTASAGPYGVESNTTRRVCTATVPMRPSLLSSTHGGLPIASTAGVSCAIVISVHGHVGLTSGIYLRPVVTDVLAEEEGGIGTVRPAITGFTLAETLRKKLIRSFASRGPEVQEDRPAADLEMAVKKMRKKKMKSELTEQQMVGVKRER